MPRVMEITTPLDPDVLLFHSIVVREEMGRLFEFDITVLSPRNDIDPNKLLGKNVTVKVELADGAIRHFDAYVTRFAFAGVHGRYLRYQIVGRPWLWFLTRTADCRIFQNKKVPDIIKDIFAKYAIASYELDKLTGTYEPWEYCVQYRETDFNFVSRLMEQEGISYFFTHADGKHTLVLADSPSAHEAYPGYAEIPFVTGERATRIEQERISEWGFNWEIQPGAYAIDDFDFKKPSVELLKQTKQKRGYAEATHEIYDYPGEYDTPAEGETYVRIRLEELQSQVQVMQGAGNARGIAAGSIFKLTGQPREDQNRKYLITAATLSFAYNDYESSESEGATYRSSFSCINNDAPFRTPRTTPKPIVQGLQTAIVVGPAGDEIYTDQYGRVKVHFHWDRHGDADENASCWMRVSHPWAGKNFGMVALPRIGQEVVVEFLEGDPDRPLITGRVYNAEQMPPWALPANKTQTGVLTRSSLGGSAANANAIRFEDKKGAEQLWIHAEKNQDIEVENDETHWVGHDRTKTIDHDETTHVKHDRTETVDNNETITIHGQRTETVDKDETITIHQNRKERVDINETISIGANRTEDVGVNEGITIGSNRTVTVGASETKTVALQRTHSVGVNETIAIGAAQEVAIGAYQTVNVGANQDVSVGANRSISSGANLSTSVGADESRDVTNGRSTNIGKDDSLKVGKNLVIDAGDSVTIKTGSASITMKKDGTIAIKGKDISIEGSGKINVKASSDITMKGSKILQN
ncbi:type VI secretion system Vgr family protein [Thauera sp. 2A1]|uniref:type VI secretion system Vgr family protein n=1 Tax=Thauera sp. 2A1 TaxID=2570191 RepID=UPI00129189FE|nr:type VI secretion system tip protein TssI/VgrG [Thauera sp. 2A1]KAI5916438.1 type VI secretion system tip protein VgrG [Thauera sp. 2A1]